MTHEGGDRVVVIGSGPSGAAAARELLRHRVPVTMLESGTDAPTGWLLRARGRNLARRGPRTTADPCRFVATGHPGTMWIEHLQPGGLSNLWTGAVPRFSRADFTDGERLHERYRWPVSYDDLVPYYERVERLLHITAAPRPVPALPSGYADHRRELPAAWEAIARVAARHGQGLTALPLADGPDWMLVRRGTAFNSFSRIAADLQRSPLFELRTGAHAVRLEWSGADRRIRSILYRDRAHAEERSLTAAAVVVACGPLRSTKLLFDSACPDFPDGLGNTDGLLGRYLHDHPKEWWSFTIDPGLPRLAPSGYLARRPYESSRPLLAASCTVGNACRRDKVLSLTPLRAARFGVQVLGSMVPTPQGYVRPSSTERDQFGCPTLEICIDFDAATIKNVEDARTHFIGLMGEAGYRCSLDPVVPQLVPGMVAHYGGTARMHRCREHGVLNAWNRPFDIPNLVVSDASCFTTNTEKNPTLTAMALSTRAAERLADDLQRRSLR
jgi:choline dehydrogenase-like flavoprotein